MLRRLIPDPFIIAMLVTIALASLLPARGDFADWANNATTIAIMLLFFLHGAKLPRHVIVEAVGHWRLHLTILGCTFALFPLLGIAMAVSFPSLLPAPLWAGMLFLCAMPSTVQSSIAFTSMARGNVAGAIAAASASNLLGIFIAPVLIGLMVQAHGATAMPLSGVRDIFVMLFLPFIVGHLLRPLIALWVDRHRKLLYVTDRSGILLAVYSAFSAAVVAGIWDRLPGSVLAMLIAVCCVLLAIALGATALIGRLLGFSREDRIAILFCGSKKSIATGVPMARVLFAGPDMGITILPLMIYHQIQLMVCAWIARHYAEDRADAA